MTQTLETKLPDRLKIYKTSPELYDAMMALSNAAAKDVEPELGELIKIRASQINHCAFCLDMHTRDARKHGVSEQKLDAARVAGGGDLHRAGAGRAGADGGDQISPARPRLRRGVCAGGGGVHRA